MNSTITRRPARFLAVALSTSALLGAFGAGPAQAALRHFDGAVVSKNSDNRTFKIKKANGNRVRFHVNGATEFRRIPGGFSGLHRGLQVGVDAKRTDNGLLARQVEKDGGGGGGGADDGPNHA